MISKRFDETSLLGTLKLCHHFSIVADKRISEKNDSIISACLRFLDLVNFCVCEEFLWNMRLTTSQNSAALFDAIKSFL